MEYLRVLAEAWLAIVGALLLLASVVGYAWKYRGWGLAGALVAAALIFFAQAVAWYDMREQRDQALRADLSISENYVGPTEKVRKEMTKRFSRVRGRGTR